MNALARTPAFEMPTLRRRIVKGIEYWLADMMIGGVRFRKSLGPTSRISEESAQKLLEGERRRILFLGPEEAAKEHRPFPFREACHLAIDSMEARRARPNSLKQARLAVKNHLIPAFGTLTCGQVDRAAVERYLALRHGQGAAPKTVNRELAVLSKVMRHAVLLGRIPRVPYGELSRLPDETIRSVRLLTIDEVGRLLASPKAEIRLAAAAGFYAGLRPDETCHLTWSGIDLAAGTLSVRPVDGWRPKTKAGIRTIPLHPVLRAELETMQARTRWHRGYVLTLEDGSPLPSYLLGWYWRQACSRLGLNGVGRHHLRHAWTSYMLMPRDQGGAGEDPKTVMELGGWSSPDIPMRIYAHTTADRKRGGIERLPSPAAQPRRNEADSEGSR